nr:hypothetical protein HmN_000753100 [Hymenolepis microstoma]
MISSTNALPTTNENWEPNFMTFIMQLGVILMMKAMEKLHTPSVVAYVLSPVSKLPCRLKTLHQTRHLLFFLQIMFSLALVPTYDLVRIYASLQGCLKAQAFGLTNIGVKLKCCKQSGILRILRKVEAITATTTTTTAVLFLGNFTSASCYDSVGDYEIQNLIS